MNNLLFICSCDWHGTQESFAEHAKVAHPHLQERLSYWHSGTVPFSFRQTIRMVKLIDGFNRTFVFYYNSSGDGDYLTFAVFLMGRKADADKYLIDFEVRRDDRKIKFLEQCLPDADDVIDEIRCGRGFTVPKRVIESLVESDKINFRFIIKRKDVVRAENALKENHSKRSLLLRGGGGGVGGSESAQNADNSKANVTSDIKAIWSDNIQPTNTATAIHHQHQQQISNKGVPKPSEHSPRDYMAELSRDYEPNVLADEPTTAPTTASAPSATSTSTYNGRPQKMDMSALTDIVQSFNLRRGPANEYNNNQSANTSGTVRSIRFLQIISE